MSDDAVNETLIQTARAASDYKSKSAAARITKTGR